VADHHPGVHLISSVQDAFDDPSIGSVVIATPTVTHGELAGRALDAGKHVFVEKPLATSVSVARALVDQAHHAGLRLFVDHTFLFDPGLEKLLDVVRWDPVRDARLRWVKLGTFGEGLHWNLLTHDAAISLALFSAIPRESVVVEQAGLVSEVDLVSARLDFGDERFCTIEIDRCMPQRSKTVRVRTESGRVLVWEGGGLWELGPDGAFEQTFSPSTAAALTRAVACFLEPAAPAGGPDQRVLPVQVVEVVEHLLTSGAPG